MASASWYTAAPDATPVSITGARTGPGPGAVATGAPDGSTSAGMVTSTQSSTNMDPTSLAALQVLIQQLMGGGTQDQRTATANRNAEITAVRNQRAGYGKDEAFADAQGAMSQQLRKIMETLVPSITRAAEGSGTSQNSMRALLLQDAATKAAESSAALGLNAAGQYGQIGSSLSGILEALTRPNNSVSDALLNALQVAKGAVTNSTSTGPAGGYSSGGGTRVNTGGSSGSGSYGNSGSMYDNYRPVSTGQSNPTSGGLEYYGPLVVTNPLDVNSLAWSQLMSGTGASSGADLYDKLDNGGWNNYTF